MLSIMLGTYNTPQSIVKAILTDIFALLFQRRQVGLKEADSFTQGFLARIYKCL